jgi:histidine triad (HIT) family protein
MDCIFCKLVNKEIPSIPIYEDDNYLVVLDINPASKGHCLIISKHHDKVNGKLDYVLKKLIEKKEKLGFKTYVLLKKAEIEHFVLNFIPIYDGKEVVYQVNNKPGKEEELKEIAKIMKIEKEKPVIVLKGEEKKEEEKENIGKNPWYVHP